MYEQSGGNKVTLVAHSMGGPVSLYFLNTNNEIVTQDWKDKHLHAYVTLSGAWAGAPIAVREIVSGYNLGLLPDDVYDDFFRSFSRTQESTVWLFPDPGVFNSTIIVSTPNNNYTAKEYMTLFDHIKYPIGYSMYEGAGKISKGFPAPKVDTHCYWGLGIPTPLSLHYNKSFPVDGGYGPDPKKSVYSDGDGLVNNITSVHCLQWGADIVEYKTFEGVTHSNMTRNYTVFDAIAKVVTNVKEESKIRLKSSDDIHKDGMFHNIMPFRGFNTYTILSAIRKMMKKIVQMMVHI